MAKPPIFFELERLSPLFEGDIAASLILTANRRQAAHISRALTQSTAAENKYKQGLPKVLPIEDWWAQLWDCLVESGHEYASNYKLLKPAQELLVWQQIIEQDQGTELLKHLAAARSAMSAHRTLVLWDVQISPLFEHSPDCAAFARWAQRFRQRCVREQRLDGASLVQRLLKALAFISIDWPKHIMPLGFYHMPPLYLKLLSQTSAELVEAKAQPCAPAINQCACSTFEDEIATAAHWAKNQITENSQRRIALVIPELKQNRVRVERILRECFEPEYPLPAQQRSSPTFNLSAGFALTESAIVDTALALLEMRVEAPTQERWMQLLRSPFILPQPLPSQAHFDLELKLRSTRQPQLEVHQMQALVAALSQREPQLEVIVAALKNHLYRHGNSPAKAPLSYWLNLWQQSLRAWGWPGHRALDSTEYQQEQRWQAATREFTELEPLCAELNEVQALTLFRRFLSQVEFQVETEDSPLQVLGTLESAGLNFDAIWLMHTQSHNWPAAPNPNPFIPYPLQRSLGMPHVSAEKELDFAQALLADYQHSCQHLIASYSKQEGDQELRPSALIEMATPLVEGFNISPVQHYALWDTPLQLPALVDKTSPLQFSDQPLKGGSLIIKQQAACPFRAFAQFRLGAEPLEEPSHHISAAERGILLHQSLEQIWCRLKDSQSLLELPPDKVESCIVDASRHAIAQLAGQRPDLLPPSMQWLEQQRLVALIQDWLTLESQRTPFSVVATEAKQEVTLAGVPLQLRLDRIDRLTNGELVLIDYKTGMCRTGAWLGPRADDPQLPLYAITLSQNKVDATPVAALAFAQINSDKRAFVGLSAREGLIPGLNTLERMPQLSITDWQQLLALWQDELTQLMQEFIQGEARVDPKPGACTYCPYPLLCRKHQVYEEDTDT